MNSSAGNINQPASNLTKSIKMNSKKKILYEAIDKDLLALMNQINNESLKNFHRDLFIKGENLEV